MTSDNSYTKTLTLAATREEVFTALTDPDQSPPGGAPRPQPAPGRPAASCGSPTAPRIGRR